MRSSRLAVEMLTGTFSEVTRSRYGMRRQVIFEPRLNFHVVFVPESGHRK